MNSLFRKGASNQSIVLIYVRDSVTIELARGCA